MRTFLDVYELLRIIKDFMARLSDETITTVLSLQRQLLEFINLAKATEYTILDQFGETDATFTALEELQNITERLRMSYSRFNTLLLRIAEAQPLADADTLELLRKTIEQAQGNIASALASIRESRGDIGL